MILDRAVVRIPNGDGTYDEHDLKADHGWTLEAPTVSIPEPKTHFVDVPGADGSLDLTEALTGDVKYYDRTIELPMWYPGKTRYEARVAVSELARLCNGKRMRIYIQGEPPNYEKGVAAGYFDARVTKMARELSGNVAKVTMTCTADPYVYVGEQSRAVSTSGLVTTDEAVLADVSGMSGVLGSITLRRDLSKATRYQNTLRRASIALSTTRNLFDASKASVWGKMAYSQADWEAEKWQDNWNSHIWSVDGSVLHICNQKDSDSPGRATQTVVFPVPDSWALGPGGYDRANDAARNSGMPMFNALCGTGCKWVVRIFGEIKAATAWSELAGVTIHRAARTATDEGWMEEETLVWDYSHGGTAWSRDEASAEVAEVASGLFVNRFRIETRGVACDLYVSITCVAAGESDTSYQRADVATRSVYMGAALQGLEGHRDRLRFTPLATTLTKLTEPGADPHAPVSAAETRKELAQVEWSWDSPRCIAGAMCADDGTPISEPVSVECGFYGFTDFPVESAMPVMPRITSNVPTICAVVHGGEQSQAVFTGAGESQVLPLTLRDGDTLRATWLRDPDDATAPSIEIEWEDTSL